MGDQMTGDDYREPALLERQRIADALHTAIVAFDPFRLNGIYLCWLYARAGAEVLRQRCGGAWQVQSGRFAVAGVDAALIRGALPSGVALTWRAGDLDLTWIVGPPGIVDFHARHYPRIAELVDVNLPPLPPVIWGDAPPSFQYRQDQAIEAQEIANAQRYQHFVDRIVQQTLRGL